MPIPPPLLRFTVAAPDGDDPDMLAGPRRAAAAIVNLRERTRARTIAVEYSFAEADMLTLAYGCTAHEPAGWDDFAALAASIVPGAAARLPRPAGRTDNIAQIVLPLTNLLNFATMLDDDAMWDRAAAILARQNPRLLTWLEHSARLTTIAAYGGRDAAGAQDFYRFWLADHIQWTTNPGSPAPWDTELRHAAERHGAAVRGELDESAGRQSSADLMRSLRHVRRTPLFGNDASRMDPGDLSAVPQTREGALRESRRSEAQAQVIHDAEVAVAGLGGVAGAILFYVVRSAARNLIVRGIENGGQRLGQIHQEAANRRAAERAEEAREQARADAAERQQAARDAAQMRADRERAERQEALDERNRTACENPRAAPDGEGTSMEQLLAEQELRFQWNSNVMQPDAEGMGIDLFIAEMENHIASLINVMPDAVRFGDGDNDPSRVLAAIQAAIDSVVNPGRGGIGGGL